MATYKEQAKFIAGMAGKAQDIGKQLEQREERAEELDKLVGKGLDSSRDELREAMTFSVKRRDGKGEVQSMDKRGQRESVETEDARTLYESMSPEDSVKATRALEKIVAIKEQMQAAKDKQGKPLFTDKDIIDELFTPLVREGLIPETLVIDGYSEVAIMLREVMGSFKGMLKEQEETKRQAEAKAISDYHNAGTKMDRVKALGSRASTFVDGQVDAVASKAGMTPDELRRAKDIAGKSVTLVKESYGAYKDGKALDNAINGGPAEQTLVESLDGMSAPTHAVSKTLAPLIAQLDKIPPGPLSAVLVGLQNEIRRGGGTLDEFVAAAGDNLLVVLRKFARLIASDGVGISKDVYAVLKEGIGGGLELSGAVTGRLGADADVDGAVKRGELRSGANAFADAVEQLLRDSLLVHSVPASDAVGGAFGQAFDADALVTIVEPALRSSPDTAPQASAVVELVGKALAAAIASAHADLQPFGAQVESTFKSAAGGWVSRSGGEFRTGALSNPSETFKGLVESVAKACKTVFDSKAFAQALTGNDVRNGLSTAARQQNEAQEQELDEANTELEDFERQLVLIDEGGMEMARQQSLDALIAQLKSDQQDLEIVLKVGSLLGGAAGSIAKMGTDSANVAGGHSIASQAVDGVVKTVATEVADSLLPALQAAQLVLKMSVTIIKIAGRAELASKFRKDVAKAHKAGSMLLPSIENFYSAKVTQQIYASIELALQTVQLAGAICSSVPEPITMAVGKALTSASKAAEAGRDLAKTVQDEAELRNGWKLTLAAINSPANRRAGLDALRHNATLAVHSIAWAATKGDPMAQEILRSCGVNAQSLADEGTDKDKVVEYLETLLNEDLKFKDARKINLDWAPSPLELSYVGWFTVKKRARGANPPLSGDPTAEVDAAIKALDLQPKLHNLQAHLGDYTVEKLTLYKTEAETLRKSLEGYTPYGNDRVTHVDMKQIAAKFQTMASDRVNELTKLVAQREQQLLELQQAMQEQARLRQVPQPPQRPVPQPPQGQRQPEPVGN